MTVEEKHVTTQILAMVQKKTQSCLHFDSTIEATSDTARAATAPKIVYNCIYETQKYRR